MEVTCCSLTFLTGQFSEHSLEDLNEEVYQGGLVSQSFPPPKALGGASVGLLMGITSTKTNPVLVCRLPNGLDIYRTLFQDCYGSKLAYGGTHQIFSFPTLKGSGSESYNQFMGEL